MISKFMPAALLLCSTLAVASSPMVVQDESTRFEVKVDPKSGKVNVDTLKADAGHPKNLSIRLFRDETTNNAIDLRALRPVPVQGRSLPKFSGELAPNSGSFAGVEIRFETNMKAWKILRSVPNLPNPKEPK